MKVPVVDLTRAYREIEPEITAAVEELLRSQRMILGPAVERFERDLAAMLGSKFAVGCASGTDALLMSLLAAGIGPGDEVVTTPFTFFATVASIVRAGAKPVFVDINPLTYNINADLITAALTERTRAILPIHLYGQSADMQPILELARRERLVVIEDAAQAIGASYRGRMCAAMGTVGCLSFYPTKNLGASGDAGACLTDDETLAGELRSLRAHGETPGKPYHHRRVGMNSRLDAIQAVILTVKMKYLNRWNEERARIARYYTESLKEVDEVEPPHVEEQGVHVFHQYVIRAARRDELVTYLAGRGVETRVFYPLAMHLQECFEWLGHGEGDFPQAERASREVLSLPIYPGLTREEQDHVVECIRRFFASGRSRVSVTGTGSGQ